jgi:membrane fusion protein (multidrug efflux system)
MPLPPPADRSDIRALPPYDAGYRDGFQDGYRDAKQEPPSDAGGKKDGQGDTKAQDEKKDGRKPLYKRPIVVLAAFVVLLAVVIGAIVFWRHSRHHETTDDAFIDGRASAVAAQVAGRVIKLHVTDNQAVRAGDVLVDIDPRDNESRREQARAQLAQAQGQVETARSQVDVRRAAALQAGASTRQAQAELVKAEQDIARVREVDAQAVSRQQVDAAEAAVRSARATLDAARSAERSAQAQVSAAEAQVRAADAELQAARASVNSADLQLSYNRVVAPVDGRVTRRVVELGNVVSPGQPMMSIVADGFWVTANYKETQLQRMRPGQVVHIEVDAYPDVSFRGRVDSVQRGTGAYFSMLPAENATGNYVKVVQRVPVKIVFDDDRVRNYAIGPGMSVKPDVEIP